MQFLTIRRIIMTTLFTKFILALLPIIWLIIALSGLKMSGAKACFSALLIALAEAVFLPYWNVPLLYAGSAALEGILNALWPIIAVIIAALFTYNLTIETGAMDSIKKILADVSDDKRILMLMIGWGFGNFMEGMAGFGTAVAIPAGIMVALGFDPILTALSCFVINTTPTAFGSVGVPTTTLAEVTGLNAGALSVNIMTIETLLMFISPFIAIMIIGRGFKALKGVFFITLCSTLAFMLPAFITASAIGAELPDILGSIVAMGVTFLLARRMKNRKIPEEYKVAAMDNTRKISFAEGIKAWSPFVLIFVFLLMTSKLVPAISVPLSTISTTVKIYAGEGAPLTFKWINTPGVIILCAAVIGGIIQKASFGTISRVFVATLKKNIPTIITICSVLATAKVMSHSGMTGDISGFLKETGEFFPLVSPVIGTIGSFVTGSGTSTGVLFGDMQCKTARAIGADPYLLAAANSMGAGIGKMISPQGLAIGAAAIGMSGKESTLMNASIKYCILCVIVACFSCYALSILGISF